MKIFHLISHIILLTLCLSCNAQHKNDHNASNNFILGLLESKPDSFQTILRNPKAYEIQVMYTQIDRDSNNNPSFKTYQYNIDKDRYFYPASIVKLPVACLTWKNSTN